MPANIVDRLVVSCRLPVFCSALFISPLGLTAELASNPFWEASVGFWVSENTYLDGHYNAKIPRYQTLNAISVNGNLVTSEERKYYPPGAFAGAVLGLDIPADEGVELIQISRGEAPDDTSIVNFAPLNIFSQNQYTRLETVSADTATMTVAYKETNEIAYKMLITIPTADSRITASLGINGHYAADTNESPLRGVSVFAASRISEASFNEQTLQLRKTYQVGTLVTIDKQGNFVATPL